jgi:hypothetical protein
VARPAFDGRTGDTNMRRPTHRSYSPTAVRRVSTLFVILFFYWLARIHARTAFLMPRGRWRPSASSLWKPCSAPCRPAAEHRRASAGATMIQRPEISASDDSRRWTILPDRRPMPRSAAVCRAPRRGLRTARPKRTSPATPMTRMATAPRLPIRPAQPRSCIPTITPIVP